MRRSSKLIISVSVLALLIAVLTISAVVFFQSQASSITIQNSVCSKDANVSSNKTCLIGRVIVGPLCPVEPCSRTLDMSNYSLILTSTNYLYATKYLLGLNSDGSFSTDQLPAGRYSLTLDDCPWLGCRNSFPVETTLATGSVSNLTISIDTGIR